MWGYDDEDDVIGRSAIDMWKDPEQAKAVLETVKQRGRWEGELEAVRADGSTFYARGAASHLTDSDGNSVGVMSSFFDITERKEREREIQKLTERLDLAVGGANLGIWDWDMTADEVEFNEQWAGMLGYSLDEIEPCLEAWETRVHPRDIDGVKAALRAHLAGETDHYETEHRMETATGEWKWVRDIGKVVERGEDGEPVRAVGIHLDIDDRKAYEQQLKEERDMFTQGPAVVFKWREAEGWPVEYVSENVEDVLGYTADTFQSGAIGYADVIHDRDRERVFEEAAEHSDGETDQFSHDPYRTVTPDGTVRWVLDHTKNIRQDGEITHRLGYLVDITERKEREQELRRTNTVLRTIVESLPMDVLVEDAERDILMANNLLGETLGIPIAGDELIGRDCATAAEELRDLFADPEGFIEGITERVERREPVQNEELPLADGRVLERDYVPYTLPEGEAHLWLYRDVTERKQRERELERTSQFLRGTQEVAHVGGWEFDLQSETLRWSDEVYRIHGVPLDADVTFEDAIKFYHPDDNGTIREALDRLMTEGDPYDLELRIVTADGDVRWVRTLGEPIYEAEAIVAVHGTFQDITERKQREQEIQRQNSRLSEFASVVSHDLRNPLTVAKARATLLEDRCDGAPQIHLDAIVTALDRMESIIADTLTLARQGNTVGEMAPVPITSLVEQCWDGVETTGATLDVADEFTIRGDRERLRHVFENLFRNAVEHGGDDVTVRVGRAGEDRFYVEDDGPGIPVDDRETVFQAGHTSATEGTGFGLTIVKRIAEAHGWEVSITDGRDGGGRFEFDGVEVGSE
ncbi:Signal transduction histidine kinase [Halapricum desulfuricans]|uniref:histidine kinase n=2 Tax=Halapricum desulfuricans TaxID=2841257 RepID=A0A897N143_9EURY|nr:Signal transduction histidine kinase [Halapricum desulfuricans]